MDKKIKKYIGFGLTGGLLITGINALFGGDSIVVSGYALLPVFAVITPLYLLFGNKQKAKG